MRIKLKKENTYGAKELLKEFATWDYKTKTWSIHLWDTDNPLIEYILSKNDLSLDWHPNQIKALKNRPICKQCKKKVLRNKLSQKLHCKCEEEVFQEGFRLIKAEGPIAEKLKEYRIQSWELENYEVGASTVEAWIREGKIPEYVEQCMKTSKAEIEKIEEFIKENW